MQAVGSRLTISEAHRHDIRTRKIERLPTTTPGQTYNHVVRAKPRTLYFGAGG